MSADLQRVIRIVFEGSNNTGKVFKEVGGDISKIGDTVQTLTGPFADAATKILKVQAAVGAALTAIGGFSIAAAGAFEDGMAEIYTLMDATPEEFENFKNEIREFFKSSLFEMDDVLGATYQSISLGIPADVVTEFLSSVEDLALAGDTTLTTAVNILANTANAYGGTIDDVSGYADTFFTAVKQGGTTVNELEASMGKVTAIAAPFGVDVEETAAAIAALTAMGAGNTAESATALARLIQDLVNPTQQASKAAEDLGIKLGADIFKNKTFSEVIAEIGEKTGYSSGEMQKLVGSSQALKALLPLVKDEANIYGGAIEEMAQKDGAAAEASVKMRETFKATNTEMAKSIENVLIGIGLPLLEKYKGAIGGIVDVINALGDEIDDGSFDPLLDYFGDVLKDIGEFARDVAKVLPDALKDVDWEELIKSFEGLEDAFKSVLDAIFGGHDLTTAEGLAKAIQVAVDGLTGLNKISTGILQQLPDFISAVVRLMEKVAEMDPERFEQIGNALGKALMLNIGAGYLTSIGSAITAVGVSIIALKGLSLAKLGGVAAAIGGAGGMAAALVALKVAIAGGAGYAVGTGLNAAIDYAVKKLSDADSLGGLIYNWVHGTGSSNLVAGHEDFDRILNAIMDNIDDFDVSDLRQKLGELNVDLSNLSDAEVIQLAIELDEFSYDDMMDLLQTKIKNEPIIAPLYLHMDEHSFDTVGAALVDMSVNRDVDVLAAADSESFNFVGQMLEDFEGDRETKVSAEADDASWSMVSHLKTDLAEDVDIPVDMDSEQVKQKAQEIDDSLKWQAEVDKTQAQTEMEQIKADAAIIQTQMEWEAKVNIAEIEAKAAIIQSKIEWDAKLDIAEVEANAKIMVALAESIGAAWDSTGTSLSAAYAAWADPEGEGKSQLYTWIEKEFKLREELLALQKEMFDTQRKYMEAKVDAMQRGDGMIQIDGAGLQPHLEAFMWEILSAIQVRVNEEGMDMLLGTGSLEL